MRLTRLALSEFRSLRNLDLVVPEPGFGLVGENAAGKSSLLEAIAMLSTTKSARASLEREVINWHSGEELGVAPYARVSGSFISPMGEHHLEIGLQSEGPRSNRVRKVISTGGSRVRAGKAVGLFKCVLFEPPDIALVSGAPARRRRLLDVLLSQLDSGYMAALSRFSRIVEQRNSLMKSLIREGHTWQSPVARTQLEYWDTELIAFASRITYRRLQVIGDLDRFARGRFREQTGQDDLITRYVLATGAEKPDDRKLGSIIAAGQRSPSELAYAMSTLLAEIRQAEFRRGATLIGPHRDDLSITLSGIDLGVFGSRGQQRLAAVALKLAEADVMHHSAGEYPVILLDDVFSELDAHHRVMLNESVGLLGAQVIVTATDRHTLEGAELQLGHFACIANGALSWID